MVRGRPKATITEIFSSRCLRAFEWMNCAQIHIQFFCLRHRHLTARAFRAFLSFASVTERVFARSHLCENVFNLQLNLNVQGFHKDTEARGKSDWA